MTQLSKTSSQLDHAGKAAGSDPSEAAWLQIRAFFLAHLSICPLTSRDKEALAIPWQ